MFDPGCTVEGDHRAQCGSDRRALAHIEIRARSRRSLDQSQVGDVARHEAIAVVGRAPPPFASDRSIARRHAT
jgi:hypothetical protein